MLMYHLLRCTLGSINIEKVGANFTTNDLNNEVTVLLDSGSDVLFIWLAKNVKQVEVSQIKT